jgi:hypothetical protein
VPACPSCGAELASEARFCPECGSAFAKATADRVPLSTSSEDTETRLSPAVRQLSSSSSWRPRCGSHSGWLSTTAVVDEGRFVPGAIMAGRYRVVGPLGRGGKGEV